MKIKPTDQMKELVIKLFEINAFKFGDFKMKVGINSPVYFDLRVIISYPNIMTILTDIISECIKEEKLEGAHVCGVPYTALPLATLVSVRLGTPMLIRRKETKSYGTKKLIEGVFKVGDKCIIIEDVVTSGSSVLDTVTDLKKEGIVVTDAIVVVDREQGGIANIAKHDVRVHSIFTLSFLLKTLYNAEKIPKETVDSVAKYIESVQINSDGSSIKDQTLPIENAPARTKIPFEKRAALAKCEVTKDLFNLMSTKQTNLCLAADLTNTVDILRAAEECGPYVCILKTHIDIIEDFSEEFIQRLKSLAKQHQFLIMEDRKFADIGNTVSLQYGKGIFKISQWADLVTAHAISGQSILQGLKSGLYENNEAKRGVFLLTEMSSNGNLIDEKYKEASRKIALEGGDVDFVAGLVCQSSEAFSFPGLIQLTPGVKIEDSHDALGQTYQSPEFVVKEKGADIAVVGRGIVEAKCMRSAAIMYRDRLWAAYEDRLID